MFAPDRHGSTIGFEEEKDSFLCGRYSVELKCEHSIRNQVKVLPVLRSDVPSEWIPALIHPVGEFDLISKLSSLKAPSCIDVSAQSTKASNESS